MTVKSSFSLTDQQSAFAHALVNSGRYPSMSAVVQQGVELLRQRTEAEEADVLALRDLVERRRNGRFVSSNDMKERIANMLERKREEHGLDR
jgi:antitoxin ParD1/3/4